MPCCGVVAQTWGRTFSACGRTSGFYTVHIDIISLAIINVIASVKAIRRDPFFAYGTQWLNDSANVGCVIAGVCGLPLSYTSCSEQQVSHSKTCCLRGWNKWVGQLPLIVTAFKQTFLLFEVWRNKIKLVRRQCLFKKEFMAWCHVVVYVSLWKVNAGGRAEPTMNYGSPWGVVTENIDFHFFKSS